MEKPLVAVIIVNYNGYVLTRDCLRSFGAVTYDRYTLIVIDNASRDDSIPRLQHEFPSVCYVKSDTNLGFTGGNNLGLAVAYEMNPDYVFFLNNDTVVSANVFELAAFLDTNPDVGMVAPLTFYHENPMITSFGGGYLNRNTGSITFCNKGVRREEILNTVIYCSFLEGAAFMARTELVKRAGGFNEDYFLTAEESDLCVRITDMGYRLALITSCSVWHKISRTMGRGSEMIHYFVYRNRLRFIKNNATEFKLRDLATILLHYLRTFASLVLREWNIPAAIGLVKGVCDYFLGVTGPGRYKERLQA
ncbi:MAG: hypothetical protein A2W25_09390 [candidate division Zixibacteria bacterium RBG_16_53_22]|nr:MAG: hypothetical protein A2W25_09390 [candidate division Zixibacteria bacterium RBG_16_53_22]